MADTTKPEIVQLHPPAQTGPRVRRSFLVTEPSHRPVFPAAGIPRALVWAIAIMRHMRNQPKPLSKAAESFIETIRKNAKDPERGNVIV